MVCAYITLVLIIYINVNILLSLVVRYFFADLDPDSPFSDEIETKLTNLYNEAGQTMLNWNMWASGTNLTFSYSHVVDKDRRILNDNGNIYFHINDSDYTTQNNIFATSYMEQCALHDTSSPCLIGLKRTSCLPPELRIDHHPTCLSSQNPYELCSFFTVTQVDNEHGHLITREMFTGELMDIEFDFKSTSNNDLLKHIACVSPLSVSGHTYFGGKVPVPILTSENEPNNKLSADNNSNETAVNSTNVSSNSSSSDILAQNLGVFVDLWSAKEVNTFHYAFLATDDGKLPTSPSSHACVYLTTIIPAAEPSKNLILPLSNNKKWRWHNRFGVCSLLTINVGTGTLISVHTGTKLQITPVVVPVGYIPYIRYNTEDEGDDFDTVNNGNLKTSTSSKKDTRNYFLPSFNASPRTSSSSSSPFSNRDPSPSSLLHLNSLQIRGVNWNPKHHKLLVISEATSSSGLAYLRMSTFSFGVHGSRGDFGTSSKFFLPVPTYGISQSIHTPYNHNEKSSSQNNDQRSKSSDSEFFDKSLFTISMSSTNGKGRLSLLSNENEVFAKVHEDESWMGGVPQWAKKFGEAVGYLPLTPSNFVFLSDGGYEGEEV